MLAGQIRERIMGTCIPTLEDGYDIIMPKSISISEMRKNVNTYITFVYSIRSDVKKAECS